MRLLEPSHTSEFAAEKSEAWRLLDLFQAASVAAALCYAMGWIFYSFALGSLGLEPEDVGIGAEYLVIRASVVAVILTIAGGGLLMPRTYFDWLRRGRRGDLGAFHYLMFTSHLVLFGVVGGAVFSATRVELNLARHISLIIAATIGAAMVLISIGQLLQALGYRAISPIGPSLSPEVSGTHMVRLGVLWIVLLFGCAGLAGVYIGDRTHDGLATRVLFLNFRCVAATPVDEAVALPATPQDQHLSGEVTLSVGNDVTVAVSVEGVSRSLVGIRLGEAEEYIRIYDVDRRSVVSIPATAFSLQHLRDADCRAARAAEGA